MRVPVYDYFHSYRDENARENQSLFEEQPHLRQAAHLKIAPVLVL